MKQYVLNIYHSSCPCCGSQIHWVKHGSLDVNVHSRNPITVENFFTLERGCKNPLCEWSKVQGDDDE